MAIVQSSDHDTTTPAPRGGHEGPTLGGPGSPRGKGRVIGLVVGAVVVVSLVAVALAAGGGHHRPIAAPVVRTSKPRSATQTTAAHAVPTTTAPATSTAVPRSSRRQPSRAHRLSLPVDDRPFGNRRYGRALVPYVTQYTGGGQRGPKGLAGRCNLSRLHWRAPTATT